MSWLTLLPVMVMLPIFLLVQGLMIFCIARIRRLVPLCGPQDREVPAKAEIELYYFHDSPCCAKVRLALEEVGLGGKSVSYSHKHYGFSKNFYALMKHPNPMIPLNRILFNLFYLRIEQGSKRERNSQLQRLLSRPFSTRFG
ncbi:hypothetical protein JL722_8892 [Aureococcus anophagefferens]|nr:hypothetical protein JL722_8892 [Aureococcus anophagefferens]